MDTSFGNQVECPICSQKFDQEAIEKHVDRCLLKSVEKPVTRNQNKSSSSFFNKQNAKRGAKNEIMSSTVTNKKTKCDFDDVDVDGKGNISEDARCSMEFCSTNEDKLSEDEIVIKTEFNEVGNQLVLNPKPQLMSSFFNKKTLKKSKNEEKNNIKKVTSTIDLTDCNENEKSKQGDNMMDITNSVNGEMNSEICCVNSVSRNNVEDNVSENSENETISNNISTASVPTLNCLTSLAFNTDSKEIDAKENSSLDNFFETNSSPSPRSKVAYKSSNVSEVNKNNSSCTPRKEKYRALEVVVGQMITKRETSPMTTFQQELFNMSQGFDTNPSPPAKSNFHVKNNVGKETGVKISQSKKHGVKASFSAKPNIPDKITGGLDQDVKEVEQKQKVKEIVLGKLPLAEQIRPRTFDNYVGQDAVGTQKLLKELFHNDRVPSMILWGPPGCGKVSYVIYFLYHPPQLASSIQNHKHIAHPLQQAHQPVHTHVSAIHIFLLYEMDSPFKWMYFWIQTATNAKNNPLTEGSRAVMEMNAHKDTPTHIQT